MLTDIIVITLITYRTISFLIITKNGIGDRHSSNRQVSCTWSVDRFYDRSYSNCKQYIRIFSTNSLSNLCVCSSPFDTRYVWLNTCNPHANTFGVCCVHFTGVLSVKTGHSYVTFSLFLYSLVIYVRTSLQQYFSWSE